MLENEETMVGFSESLKFASMTHRINDYCNANPGGDNVQNYLTLRAQKARGFNPPQRGGLSLDAIHADLEQIVLGSAAIVGSTLDSSHDLVARNFKADVVIIDEVSTINEPAALVPFRDQRPDVVILAGDLRQLPPQTFSKPGENPLVEYLQISFAERWCDTASPKFPVVQLKRNYRQRGDMFRLTNEVFYKSEMEQCAPPLSRTAQDKEDSIMKGFGQPGFGRGVFTRTPRNRV